MVDFDSSSVDSSVELSMTGTLARFEFLVARPGVFVLVGLAATFLGGALVFLDFGFDSVFV